MPSVLAQYAMPMQQHRQFVGDTKTSLISEDHGGWLLCDGRSLAKDQYKKLYNVIGAAFGGDEASFRLPDPAGRAIGAIGQGLGLTERAAGDAVGEETHTLIVPEMPSHDHTGQTGLAGQHLHTGTTDTNGIHSHGITDPGHAHSYFNQPYSVNPATSLTTTDVADNVNIGQTTGTSTTGITINNAGNHVHTFTTSTQPNHLHTVFSEGGDQPHNNMQPTLFLGNVFIFCGDVMKNAVGVGGYEY